MGVLAADDETMEQRNFSQEDYIVEIFVSKLIRRSKLEEKNSIFFRLN